MGRKLSREQLRDMANTAQPAAQPDLEDAP